MAYLDDGVVRAVDEMAHRDRRGGVRSAERNGPEDSLTRYRYQVELTQYHRYGSTLRLGS